MKLLIIFIVLNILNTVIGTKKSTATINGTRVNASMWNGLSYGVNTIVVIYMNCELPLFLKALVVFATNFIGVYIVKTIDKMREKDKLWKVQLFGKVTEIESIVNILNDMDIKFSIVNTNKVDFQYINIYCYSKEQSQVIKDISKFYELKYFASEGKSL